MTDARKGVRVRMAPGPTGAFHIGRMRTALINWLFARHHGGTFVLRIEDTDRNRSKPEFLQTIFDSLRWLGLDWDEGPDVGGPYEPYFQMGRLHTYQEAAQRLVEMGKAYPCYCSAEELDELRKKADAERRPFRYPRTCRNLTPGQRSEREAEGRRPVLRLAIPDGGATGWTDLVMGSITIENVELDDWVITRANGIPTYNFAVVIDDTSMAITHVLRGQEHIPNTPRQILVYRFLGYNIPEFGHLPLVQGMDRAKLSARHGAQPVTMYGQEGYLPEAIFNYLAILGISYEAEREIFPREEIVTLFDLGKIGRAGAVFSDEKLEWMNGVYIRSLSLEDFVERSLPFLQIRELIGTPPSDDDVKYATRALRLEQERVRTLAETPDAVEFFFVEPSAYDPAMLIGKKGTAQDARRVLDAALKELESSEDFTRDALEQRFRAMAERLEIKTGVVFGTIRVAITGRTAAPPLFDTMEVLGKDRVKTRMTRALEALKAWNP